MQMRFLIWKLKDIIGPIGSLKSRLPKIDGNMKISDRRLWYCGSQISRGCKQAGILKNSEFNRLEK